MACALAIRRREISCEQLTQTLLARIDAHNEHTGAFVDVAKLAAIHQARATDRALALGEPQGTLLGVPIAIKDVEPMRGAFHRMGSRTLRYAISPVDGPIASILRDAGMTLIGKTATPELALLPITEPAIHAPTRTPWNLDFNAGGSSGGAAAAVASHLVPIAQGSDAAGSIRIPAACCGLFGFKPSRGLLQDFYRFVDRQRFFTAGALSWTVADTALFLDVMRGQRYPPDAPSLDSLLHQSRQTPRPLRIAFTLLSPLGEVTDEVARATLGIVETLRQVGHDVHERPPMRGQLDEFLPLWQRMAANVPLPFDHMLQAPTRWLRHAGRQVSQRAAQQRARELEARVLDWLGGVDAWVTPTVGTHSPRVHAYRTELNATSLDAGEAVFRALCPLAAFTAPLNVGGQPAANVPAGVASTGVPIGVQLIGRRGADGALLALCQQLFDAKPWPLTIPTLAQGAQVRDA